MQAGKIAPRIKSELWKHGNWRSEAQAKILQAPVTATLESEKEDFPDDLVRQTNSLHQLWVREIKWGALKEGTLRLVFTFVCIHAPTLQRAVRTRTQGHIDSRSENYRG